MPYQAPPTGNPFAEPLLSPVSSINRTRLFAEHSWAQAWYGQLAGDVLSRRGWIAAVVATYPQLANEPDPLLAFEANPDLLAQAVAADLGDRLAALALTLRRGSAVSRADRTEWDDGAWRFWSSRSTLIIGGGLVSGRLGPAVVAQARSRLDPETTLELAPSPRDLALIGAASLASSPGVRVLAMDLGQTSLKRAVVKGDDFHRLPTLPVDPSLEGTGILSLLTQAVEPFDGAEVRLAVASYLEPSGSPIPYGFVGRLRDLSDDVPTLLGHAFAAWIGRPIKVSLIHDGTAAALPFADRPYAAVLVFGTAIGIGVPPCPSGT